MSLFRDRVDALAGKRKLILKVHAPTNPADPVEFSRFVNEVNRQLSLVSEHVSGASDVDTSDFITTQALEDRLTAFADEQNANNADQATSQNPDGPTDTSVGAPNPPEDAAAAVQNAAPDAAPPPVKTTSDIGTTTDPLQFSLEDHTHAGYAAVRVNSGGAENTRRRLNLIAGTNVTVALADDGIDDETDVTISVPSTGTTVHTASSNITTAAVAHRLDRTILDANCVVGSVILARASSLTDPDAESFNVVVFNVTTGQFDIGVCSLEGPYDFSNGYNLQYMLI